MDDEVVRAGRLQAFGDADEQLVPHTVAIGVVDALEAVEIEDADGEGLRGLGEGGLLQRGEEHPSVGEAGQAVEIGQAEVLVAQGEEFRLVGNQRCLGIHKRNKVLRVAPHHEDDHREHEHVVRGHEREDRVARPQQQEHHRRNRGGDHRKHGGRGLQQAEKAADAGEAQVEQDMRPGRRRAVLVERDAPEREHDRQAEGENAHQVNMLACGFRVGDLAAPACPDQQPDGAADDQGSGDVDREIERRHREVAHRHEARVDDQDAVEKRHLVGQRDILRDPQFTSRSRSDCRLPALIRHLIEAPPPHGGLKPIQVKSR